MKPGNHRQCQVRHYIIAYISSLSRLAISLFLLSRVASVCVFLVSLNPPQFSTVAAKQTWLLSVVYGCLGALLMSAFAISAAEGAGTVEFSSARTVDDYANGARSVVAADIDGDGDNDIVAAIYGAGDIFWYQNLDGKGNFAEGDEISDILRPT